MHTTVYTASRSPTTFRSIWPVVLVIFCIAFAGLAVLDDYGATTDEKFDIDLVGWNSALVREGTPIPSNGRYYGTVPAILGESAYQIARRISNWPAGDWMAEFPNRIRAKHAVAFGFSMLAYASAAGLAAMLIGLRYAWIAPLLLFLYPRFTGHSFFNPKDIPFAAMFTLATFGGAQFVRHLVSHSNRNRTAYVAAAVCGAVIGVATGVRIGAIVLLAFVPAAHLLLLLIERRVRDFIRDLPLYAILVAAWFFVTVAAHPSSWSNPFRWIYETLQYMSSHPFTGTVLFQGSYWKTTELPWHYLPTMLFLTTPEIWTALFVFGTFTSVSRLPKLATGARSALLLILFQVFLLPLYAILFGANMYDGIRHFLFVLPGMAVFGGAAIAALFESSRNRWLRVTFVMLLTITGAIVLIQMVRLHPYQYCFYNATSGGLKAAVGKYETDYWALSVREGMEWINRHAPPASLVVSSREVFAAWSVAREGIEVMSLNRYFTEKPLPPYYYIAKPRWDYQKQFPDCPIVFTVHRMQAPLTIVKHCAE